MTTRDDEPDVQALIREIAKTSPDDDGEGDHFNPRMRPVRLSPMRPTVREGSATAISAARRERRIARKSLGKTPTFRARIRICTRDQLKATVPSNP
jgi:hypothetical protein